MKLNKIKINQSEELISNNVVNSLYKLTSESINDILLSGSLEATSAKVEKVLSINDTFSDVNLTYLDETIIDAEDSENEAEIVKLGRYDDWNYSPSKKVKVYKASTLNFTGIVEQEFNTGYIATSNTKIELKAKFRSFGYNYLIAGTLRDKFGIYVNNTEQPFSFTNGNYTTNIFPLKGEIYIITDESGKGTINGIEFLIGPIIETTVPIKIGYLGWGSSLFDGELYYFKIYESGELVRHYIPVWYLIGNVIFSMLYETVLKLYYFCKLEITKKLKFYIGSTTISSFITKNKISTKNINYKFSFYGNQSKWNTKCLATDLSCLQYFNYVLNNYNGGWYLGSNTSVEKIIMPDSCTNIEHSGSGWSNEGMFSGCSNLKYFKAPNLIKIEAESWGGTNNRPHFNGCLNMEIFDTAPLEYIGNGTFSGMTKLSQINISDTIYHIGDSAFKNTNILFINLPESVTELVGFPWTNTTGTQIHPLYNSYYLSWGGYKTANNALTNCVINNDNLQTDGEGNIILKLSLKIGALAFYNNTNLKSISGMSEIGVQAFYGCTRLTGEIDCNGSNIGTDAFRGCSKITNVKNGSIGTSTGVFYECTGLTEISNEMWDMFGDSIPLSSFRGCTSLIIINIPNTITTINGTWDHFTACSKLRKVILPETIISFSSCSWNDCTRLRWINFNYIKNFNDEPFRRVYCIHYLEFNLLESIHNFICVGLKILYLNLTIVPTWRTTPNLTSFTSSSQFNFYVPIGLKSLYEADSNWNIIADRIIEVNSNEMESIKKSWYGVDFFGDKYYDTKKIFTFNSKIEIEFEIWQLSLNFICGVNNFRFQHFRNDAFNFNHWNNSIYEKNTLSITNKQILLNGTVKWSGNYTDLSTTLSMYLGNFNNNGFPYNGRNANSCTIYKFLWYESDELVQAWLGNENGGFDIYADEDIELQENDRKFNLNEYIEE